MKKAIYILILLALFLSACNSKTHIITEHYEISKVEKPWSGGATIMEMSRYAELTESDLVLQSALIVKVKITEDPVEYSVSFRAYGETQKIIAHVYKAKILKVYHTDNPSVKEGGTIRISRRDYTISRNGETKYIDPDYIKTNKDNTYILFMDTLENMQNQEEAISIQHGTEVPYLYRALDETADYIVLCDFRGIIHCVGNQYEFSDNFVTLGSGATRVKSTLAPNSILGFLLLEDDQFDKKVQLFVDDCLKDNAISPPSAAGN